MHFDRQRVFFSFEYPLAVFSDADNSYEVEWKGDKRNYHFFYLKD